MDPRDAYSIQNRQPSPPPQSLQQQGVMMIPPPQQTQPFRFGQPFPNSNVFMMGVPNSGNPNLFSNPNFSFAPFTGGPYPFDSGPFASHHHPKHHQQQQRQQPETQTQPNQQRGESPAPGVSDVETATVTASVGSEKTKKKRGRPTKYSPASEGITQFAKAGGGTDGESETHEGNAVEGSKEKKKRGRPLGSRKKQSDSVGAVAGGMGVAFHMIIVPEGENIVSKLVELCQGPRIIFVTGASGSVRNVTLRHVAGGTAYHEGQFDIASLSGSCFENNDGSQNNNLNLTVILAEPDGTLFGGGVTRELIAASSIQMVAGSFIAEKNQSNTSPIPLASPLPTPAPRMFSFGSPAPAPPNNSTQHDEESNGHDGHPQNQNPGFYNYGQPWNGGTPGWT